MNRAARGVTLIELLVVIAVIAILAALAFPSFAPLFERNILKGAGERILNELHSAKFEAVKRNQPVYVSVSGGASWCYGAGTSAACNCTNPNDCDLGTASADDFRGVTATANGLAAVPTTLVSQFFEPVMGRFTNNVQSTCSPSATSCRGSITLTHPRSGTLEVQLFGTGRVRLCAPGGANVAGGSACL
jgi:type IV fimbrial biogenesis protein FimT